MNDTHYTRHNGDGKVHRKGIWGTLVGEGQPFFHSITVFPGANGGYRTGVFGSSSLFINCEELKQIQLYGFQSDGGPHELSPAGFVHPGRLNPGQE